MKTSNILEKNIFVEEWSVDSEKLEHFLHLLGKRSNQLKMPMTAVFLSFYSMGDLSFSQFNQQLRLFMRRKIRRTDYIFKLLPENEWCIVLDKCNFSRAKLFLQRLTYDIDVFPYLDYSAEILEVCKKNGSQRRQVISRSGKCKRLHS